ncbi:hypothetical protein BJ742DRAFT_397486 [Cladochytrium replicatum]|nr:hypothetical protein BJ742DRAFT_397486 [Cladochytrium replicatum]
MKLTQQIKLRLVLPIGIGMLVLGVATLIPVVVQAPSWIDDLSVLIRDIRIDAFIARTSFKAAYVTSFVASSVVDVQMMGAFMAGFARGDLGVVTRPYPSYFYVQVDNVNPPIPSDKSFYSTYFNRNITTAAQLAAAATGTSLNSTTLDIMMRALYVDQSIITQVQLGFEDGGFRFFPYEFDGSASPTYRTGRFCDDPALPADIRGAVGYLPACRAWYRSAIIASQNGPDADGVGPTVLIPPYVGASSNRAKISAAQTVFQSSRPFGVASADIDMQTFLQSFSRNSKILDNGYLFMMDSQGNLIVYDPAAAKGLDIYAQITNVASVEFANDTAAAASFIARARQLSNSSTASSSTFQRGNAEWRLAAYPVPGSDYLVVGEASSADIEAAANEMRSRTTVFIGVASAIIFALLLVALYVSNRLSLSIAERVLRPVGELSSLLDNITRGDLNMELRQQGPVSREIDILQKSFKDLTTALRFGNEKYYQGHLDKALANYVAAERLMTELNSERGKGVCWNNMGNVYAQMNQFNTAQNYYDRAIASGMLPKCQIDRFYSQSFLV